MWWKQWAPGTVRSKQTGCQLSQVHAVRHTLLQLHHRYASLGMTRSSLPWRRWPGHNLAKEDHCWEARIGHPYWKQVHCVRSVPSCSLSCLCFAHRLFQTAKIGSLVGIQDSKDPEGSWVLYYLVQSEGTSFFSYFPRHESWIVPLHPFLTVLRFLYAMAYRPDRKDLSALCLCTDPSSQLRLPALSWRLSPWGYPLSPHVAGYPYVYDYPAPVSPTERITPPVRRSDMDDYRMRGPPHPPHYVSLWLLCW